MKWHVWLLLPVILLEATLSAGQTLYTKTDSIPFGKDTLIRLRVANHRGDVQWQKSIDGINWANIPQMTTDSIPVKKDAEASYRVVIREGTCLPVYSDVARIAFNKPEVKTDTVVNITHSSAMSSGQVVSDGGTAVTNRGLCWNTTGDPTASDRKIMSGAGTGIFKGTITGLKANQKYYIRAFATNSKGTAYGPQKSFMTPASGSPTGTFTDNRDGRIYHWVQIGNQVWMSENLAWLPSVNPPNQQYNASPAYYVLGYTGTNVSGAKATANYQTYGALYNWTAAVANEQGSFTNPSGVKGACPEGWHLPSDAEWTQLTDFLTTNGYGYKGSGEDVAKSLASVNNWRTDTVPGVPGNSPAENNITGFSALPGGIVSYGAFGESGYLTAWWSSSSYFDFGWYRSLTYIYAYPGRYLQEHYYGFAIRCVRNNATDPSNEAPLIPFNPSPVDRSSVIPLKPGFTWDAADPEGDILSFDVYLGTSLGSLSPVSSGQSAKSYTPSVSLNTGTAYFWKIVATDKDGLSTESPVWQFTTTAGPLTGEFTDIRDGRKYKWVQIGNQGWMAENLAWLPSVNPSSASSKTLPRYYVYEYEGTSVTEAKTKSNYLTYGALYNWTAASAGAVTSDQNPSGVRGACPEGWHLPGEREYLTLITYLIGNGFGYQGSGEDIAKAVAAKTNWKSTSEDGVPGKDPAGNNSTGFSGLPGGQAADGYFDELNWSGRWWTATESSNLFGWYSVLSYDQVYFTVGGSKDKNYGLSVRCVRD